MVARANLILVSTGGEMTQPMRTISGEPLEDMKRAATLFCRDHALPDSIKVALVSAVSSAKMSGEKGHFVVGTKDDFAPFMGQLKAHFDSVAPSLGLTTNDLASAVVLTEAQAAMGHGYTRSVADDFFRLKAPIRKLMGRPELLASVKPTAGANFDGSKPVSLAVMRDAVVTGVGRRFREFRTFKV